MSADDETTTRPPAPGRRDILEAAATAFTRNGYAATTIDDIAREMGATKGRVYHYYRAKADVFLDIVTTGMQELIDGIEPIAGNGGLDPATRLWRMAHHHAGLMMTRNSFQRVAMRAVEMRRLGEAPTMAAQQFGRTPVGHLHLDQRLDRVRAVTEADLDGLGQFVAHPGP